MLASLRAFLGDVLDYAGLFPPAQLPLGTSIRNYVRYRAEPEAWMLARFICSANRLPELGPYVREHFSSAAPLRLSALGRGGDAPDVFLDNLRFDLEAIARFAEAHGSAVAVEGFETRLPASLLGDRPETSERLLSHAADVFASQGLAALARFYELPTTADWPRVARALATQNPREMAEVRGPVSGRGLAGLKLRCGGADPTAIPSVAQVASVIEACLSTKVMLKFTAGLHVPTRRVDPALGACLHGFLNLFAAGILSACLGLEHHDLMAVIEEEDAHEFTFSKASFAWRDAEVTVDEIKHARRQHVVSFGSCSFDEPRDGLRELGYI
jgi:hypothetical protein